MKKRVVFAFLSILSVFVLTILNDIDSYASENVYEPYVLLSSYEVSGGEIIPNEEFNLRLHVKNMDEEVAANAVLVSVSGSSGIYSAYTKVSQIYLPTIEPGEEKELNFTFIMSDDYGSENAFFSIDIENGSRQNSVIVTAPVERGDNLFSVVNKSIPSEAMEGQLISSSVRLKSLENDNLSNVYLRVYDGSTQIAESYIGNISAGASKTQNASFSLYGIGEHKLVFYIECIDVQGQFRKEMLLDGKINVSEASAENYSYNNNGFATSYSDKDFAIIISCGVISLILIIGIIIVAKKKK